MEQIKIQNKRQNKKKTKDTDQPNKHFMIQTIQSALKPSVFTRWLGSICENHLICAEHAEASSLIAHTHPFKRSEIFAWISNRSMIIKAHARLADQNSIQTQTTTDFVLIEFGFTVGLFSWNLSEIWKD